MEEHKFRYKFRIILALLLLSLLGFGSYWFDRWQRQVIFLPTSKFVGSPRDRNLQFKAIERTSPQNTSGFVGRVQGWWVPQTDPEAASVLFLHGNADTMSTKLDFIEYLYQLGFSVFAIDYRGYGASTQTLPDETSVYADAETAWDEMLKLSPHAGQRIIYGHSLGGAIAIDLASKAKQVDALVVEGTFSSLKDLIAETKFGWLPLNVVLTQRFASDEKIRNLKMPKLFIHCSGDTVVKPKFGQKLFEQSAEPKTKLIIEKGTHNACFRAGGLPLRDALRSFGSRVLKQ